MHGNVDFGILQSPLSILHNYTESKTFLPGINAFPGVDIEQADVLDKGGALGFKQVKNGLQGEILVDNDGQVTDGGGLF